MKLFITRNGYNYTVYLTHPTWQRGWGGGEFQWRNDNVYRRVSICTAAGNALCKGLDIEPLSGSGYDLKVLVMVDINVKRGTVEVTEWVHDEA